MGVRLQLPAHHHAGQSGDMEGRGHGRPFRQDPEASGSGGWSPKLPSYSRLQSLLHWSANHHWTQEHPREGDREDLPQGGQDHLAELETRTELPRLEETVSSSSERTLQSQSFPTRSWMTLLKPSLKWRSWTTSTSTTT